MELIDKAAVVAEIERRIKSNAKEMYFGRLVEDNYFLDFINTLEGKDVDLEKEIDSRIGKLHTPLHYEELKDFAKHFFELGLSHSIDESVVRKIVDLYFEAVKHYDEVIKHERNETGGSQLAIDILDGSKDMKELCVRYVLDKVTKE